MPDTPQNTSFNPDPVGRTDDSADEAQSPIVIPPDLFADGVPELPPEALQPRPRPAPEVPPPSAAPRPQWDRSLSEVAGIEDASAKAEPAPPAESMHGPPAPAGESPGLDEAAQSALAAGPKVPPKGTSRLGLLALLLGVAACVMCRRSILPPYEWLNPVWPAAVGLVLVFLALVAKVFGSRTKLGVPVLALLLCLAAIGIAGYEAGVRDVHSGRTWANGQVAQVRKYIPSQSPPAVARPTPANPANPIQPFNPAAPGQPAGGASPPLAGPTPAVPPGGPTIPRPAPGNSDDDIGAGTIFDMKHGTAPAGSGGTPAVPAPTAPSGSSGTSAFPLPPGTGAAGRLPGSAGTTPRPSASADPRVQAAVRGLQAAEGKVRSTEEAFRSAYVSDKANHPDYLAAEAQVQATEQLVADAKRRSDGYGTPLIEATKQRKEAQEKAARVVNQAMDRDPRVQAARKELTDAQASLRAAYQAAQASPASATGR